MNAQDRVQALLAEAADVTKSRDDRHIALDRIHMIKRRGHYGLAKLGLGQYTLGTARISINRD